METREEIAKHLLDLVTRFESDLVRHLSPKVQKSIDYQKFTWKTISEYQKSFWLEEADKVIKLRDK